MSFDLLINLLPLINLAGIPLLVIGIIVLVSAYHRANQTYMQTYTKLVEDNDKVRKGLVEETERLRKALAVRDKSYFGEMEKMKGVVAKIDSAAEELYAMKITLLTKAENIPDADILADVQKIDEAIELMHNLFKVQEAFERNLIRREESVKDGLLEVQNHFRSLKFEISKLAEQIADTKSRTFVLSVVTSEKAYEEVKSETMNQPRGLIVSPTDAKSAADDVPTDTGGSRWIQDRKLKFLATPNDDEDE